MPTSMTRQHFQAVADAVSRYSRAHGQRVIMPEVLAEMLADELSQFSPAFDRARFMAACQPKGK